MDMPSLRGKESLLPVRRGILHLQALEVVN